MDLSIRAPRPDEAGDAAEYRQTSPKLTCWVRGTNPSSLGRKF